MARQQLGTAPIYRRRPLSADQIVAMAAACPSSLTGLRDRAVLLIGWCAALRRSEIVGLNVEHVETVGDGVRLCIAKSKTDQQSHGQFIGLPDRGSKDRIKPIVALRTWMRAAKIRGEGTAIFQRVNKSDKLQGRLDGGSVNTIVRHYAAAAGFDTHLVGAHSLRTGFATAAAEAGATSSDAIGDQTHRPWHAARLYPYAEFGEGVSAPDLAVIWRGSLISEGALWLVG